jgi:hypothetical protein
MVMGLKCCITHTHEVYTPLGGFGVSEDSCSFSDIQVARKCKVLLPATEHQFIATRPRIPRKILCSPDLLVQRGRCRQIPLSMCN